MFAAANQKTLYLYHDADWSNYTEASESIWRGVSVALQEVDYSLQGYRIEVVKKIIAEMCYAAYIIPKPFLRIRMPWRSYRECIPSH
jgi:hypothetical protein